MTPAARVAAAIEILDQIGDGAAAEQVLTRWARGNRFAGSKDRAAIRDHVFDALRMWRSTAWLGGAETGRGRMIGLLRAQGVDPAGIFTGTAYGPPPLEPHESVVQAATMPRAVAWNLPDWLAEVFDSALGPRAQEAALALQGRAPVTLRVNAMKSNPSEAALMLKEQGVVAVQNPLGPSALTVTQGARRIRNTAAYLEGVVELQDASSQAVVDALPQALRALDYCAGGGGKSLGLAARGQGAVFAHDIDTGRMADLPVRAARAGVQIAQIPTAQLSACAPFDLVLVDAPCSGSGSWRRAAQAKWWLTPEDLEKTTRIQDGILDHSSSLVGPGGILAYATCSVLRAENEDRIAAFVARHPHWRCLWQKSFDIGPFGDGFYTAHLTCTA